MTSCLVDGPHGSQTVRFYGLARARRESWKLVRFPRPQAQPRGLLTAMRLAGAVVVDCVSTNPSARRDGQRLWWFGLPPAHLHVPLRRLAELAGMTEDPPATFRWIVPRN